MSRSGRSPVASAAGRRRGVWLLALLGLAGGVAWLLRPPEDTSLRELAQAAGDARHGVIFVAELGALIDWIGGAAAGTSAAPTLGSGLASWLRSSPGVFVVGPEGLEARLDLSPGRAMAAKLTGHLRRDAWLRGGTPEEDPTAAVWWERGPGRSTSRWALARSQRARHLLDLESVGSSRRSGDVLSAAGDPDDAGDAWLAFPEIGSWRVWFGEPEEVGSADPGTERIRLTGMRASGGAPDGPPRGEAASAWVEAGLDPSELLGPSTWLLWAERDGEVGRVTLWRRSMARRDGAALDVEVPRIARLVTGPRPTAAEIDTLPAQDLVRRLGGEVQHDELPDGTILVGYDTAAVDLLRRETSGLRALVRALPPDGSVWFVRPAALASWWRVTREFGRLGGPAPTPWWERDPSKSVLSRVQSAQARLDSRSATVEVVFAVPEARQNPR